MYCKHSNRYRGIEALSAFETVPTKRVFPKLRKIENHIFMEVYLPTGWLEILPLMLFCAHKVLGGKIFKML